MGAETEKQMDIMNRKEEKKMLLAQTNKVQKRNANSDTQKRCSKSITEASVNWERNARTTTTGKTAKNGNAVHVTIGTTAR